MSFKTELHCHTSEFSRCASQSGVDAAEDYIKAGYTTVVVANHFCDYYPHDDYPEYVRTFFRAGEIMREAAGDRLNVIIGMEMTFQESVNDYLVYGMTEELALSIPEVFDMGVHNFHEWAKERGIIVVQAHPTRFRMEITPLWDMDGIEIYNASHDPYFNDAAELWANLYDTPKYNKTGRPFIRTSGSDHHHAGQRTAGGIETEKPITTMDELVSTLRSGEYKLLRAEDHK